MPTPFDQAPWDDYKTRVAELFRPLVPGDGVDEAEVGRAEERLGLRLPRVLREFYLLAGLRDDLNRRHDRLVPLDRLGVVAGGLVFYEENQGALTWAIPVEDLAGDDPPVVESGDPRSSAWSPATDRLSKFLVAELYLQAVNGALPNVGVAAVDETMIPEVHRYWHGVEFERLAWRDMIVFHRPGQVLAITGRAPDLQLMAGARSREGFEAIERRLKLTWDSCSREGDGGIRPLDRDEIPGGM